MFFFLYRETLYLNGGILFVTSRILVVDMLTKKLPIHLVTGIVVCKAHKYVVDEIRIFFNTCKGRWISIGPVKHVCQIKLLDCVIKICPTPDNQHIWLNGLELSRLACFD